MMFGFGIFPQLQAEPIGPRHSGAGLNLYDFAKIYRCSFLNGEI